MTLRLRERLALSSCRSAGTTPRAGGCRRDWSEARDRVSAGMGLTCIVAGRANGLLRLDAGFEVDEFGAVAEQVGVLDAERDREDLHVVVGCRSGFGRRAELQLGDGVGDFEAVDLRAGCAVEVTVERARHAVIMTHGGGRCG